MQQAGQAAAWSCELLASRLRHAKPGPLGAGNAASRRVRRVVGVGMGMLRHDGEDDAVLVLGIRGRARYAQAYVPKRSCDMRNLSASLDRITELMHSWGFALREGVFAENKDGICTYKDKKASFKNS